MKKTIALLMVCALLTALTGCWNGGTPAPGSSSATESSAAPLPGASGTA